MCMLFCLLLMQLFGPVAICVTLVPQTFDTFTVEIVVVVVIIHPICCKHKFLGMGEHNTNRTTPSTSTTVSHVRSCLEAFAVNNGWARLIVLLL